MKLITRFSNKKAIKLPLNNFVGLTIKKLFSGDDCDNYFKLLNKSSSNKQRHFIFETKKEQDIDTEGTAKNVIEKFTRDVLPKIEQFVEKKILDEYSENLTPLEKETAYDAYGLRRYKAEHFQKKKEIRDKLEPASESSEVKVEYENFICSSEDANSLNYTDIGKYYIVPDNQASFIFPNDAFGNFYKENFVKGKELAVLLREEAFLLKTAFSNLKTPNERKPFMLQIKEQILNDKINLYDTMKSSFFYYSLIHQEVSELLLDFLNSFPDERLRMLFCSGDILEGLVSTLLNSFSDKDFCFLYFCLEKSKSLVIKQILILLYKNFAVKASINKTDLKELDHRITAGDLITYRFFYQIQTKLRDIHIEIDEKIIENEIANLNMDKKLKTSYKIVIDQERFTCLDLESDLLNKSLIENKPKNNEIIEKKEIRGLSNKEELKNLIKQIYQNEENENNNLRKETKTLKKKLKEEVKEESNSNFKKVEKQYYSPIYKYKPQEIDSFINNERKLTGFNSNVLLWGDSGIGKSGILNFLQIWAKQNNWFVVPLYRVRPITQNARVELVEEHTNGLYLQIQLAKSILLDIKLANMKLLTEIKNFPNYGKTNYAGEFDGQYESLPSLWDEKRDVYTDSWRTFELEDNDEISDKYPQYNKRISDYLPNPKNLMEVVDFGLENQDFATNAIAEVLANLRFNKNVKSMVLVDEYNEFFTLSDYSSYKFANQYQHQIPPFALALARLFIDFNGHLSYNGVKVCATSLKKYYGTYCTAQDLMISDRYALKISNLQLNEMRNLCMYYNYNTKLIYGNISDTEVRYALTFSQGNIGEAVDFLKFGYEGYATPQYPRFLEREARKVGFKMKDELSAELTLKRNKERALKRAERLRDLRRGYNLNPVYI